jgi:hypothetical protein
MTTTPAHVRVPQLRLPGQAAAPEGPVDMTMMYLMHHAFRRDLALFAEVVPCTPVEDRRAWQALERRWSLFSAVLHNHHEGEDRWLWPELVRRAEPEERATLEAMEAEHAEIDPLLQACRDGLASMASAPTEATRSALAVRLVAARESLARHLRHEETDTMALLQRVFTQQDWDAVDEHFKAELTFGLLVKAVPWALQGVPADVREGIFAMPGGTAHRVMWLLTRRRFERAHRRAFRHLPA